jgi:D-alanyl-D-alanine dipeptidase
MQLLGILILLGLLVLLLIAGMYFANTQKTPNRRSGSALDDLYRSKGMGNVLDARERLDEMRSTGHRHHTQVQEKGQHHRHEEE